MKIIPPQRQQQFDSYEEQKKYLERKMKDLVMFEDALDKGYEENPELEEQLVRAKMVPILREYYKLFVVDSVEVTDAEIEELYNAEKEKRFSHRPRAEIKQFVCEDKETADYVLYLAKKSKK